MADETPTRRLLLIFGSKGAVFTYGHLTNTPSGAPYPLALAHDDWTALAAALDPATTATLFDQRDAAIERAKIAEEQLGITTAFLQSASDVLFEQHAARSLERDAALAEVDALKFAAEEADLDRIHAESRLGSTRRVADEAQIQARDLLAERTLLNSRIQSLLERLYDKASNDHVSRACDFADLLARERLAHDATKAALEAARRVPRCGNTVDSVLSDTPHLVCDLPYGHPGTWHGCDQWYAGSVFPTRAEWVERTEERSELEHALVEVERMRPVLEAARDLVENWRMNRVAHGGQLTAAVDVYNQPPSPDGGKAANQ